MPGKKVVNQIPLVAEDILFKIPLSVYLYDHLFLEFLQYALMHHQLVYSWQMYPAFE